MKKLLLGIIILFSVVLVISCNGEDITIYDYEPEINTVAIHRENVIYLDEDNQVFTKGENRHGQLGDGGFQDRTVFINITDNFNLSESEFIKSVALGEYHAAALSNTGRVFTWGHNAYGKLGVIPGDDRNMPVDITDNFDLGEDDKIVFLNLGRDNGAVISQLGNVYTWGANAYGQLGNGVSLNPWEETEHEPFKINENFNLIADEQIIKVALGNNHGIALTNIGRVFTWGSNEVGQLGTDEVDASLLPIDITDKFMLDDEMVIDIDLGYDHSGVLIDTGRVYVFGDNAWGQLGLGTEVIQVEVPEEITNDITIDETILRISLAHNSSAVLTDENVYVFGFNNSGQLGIGNTTTIYNPVTVDLSFVSEGKVADYLISKELTALITEDGDLYFNQDNTWEME
ncbi:MAG: RCC1 domain-containing protein [Bacillota bacterium]